jgi:hypothetical protein
MSPRVRLAGAAIVLLLASASVSFAQQADTTHAATSGVRPARGSIGAQGGGSWILANDDYSRRSQPRFSFEGSFGYVFSKHWRWRVNPYFTWNSYRAGTPIPFADPNFPADSASENKSFFLTQVVGANAQIQYVHTKANWTWHIGAGGGGYRVVVENHRKVLKDPVTKRLHRGLYPSATVEFGVERFMRSLPNTSLEWTVAGHAVGARRNDQFPSGFNGTPMLVELRFGGHYYFDFTPAKKAGSTPAPRR